MRRDSVALFYLIFVYGTGLAIRLNASDFDLVRTIFTSLFIDTVIVLTVMTMAKFFLRNLIDRLSAAPLIIVSVTLALVSGGIAFSIVEIFRDLGLLLPTNPFHRPIVFTYFSMMAALYNLQLLWVAQTQLASERALAVIEAERRAALSELRRLRTQIQPHFLFNMLNNIQIELSNSPANASTMLTMLSDHLRHALELEDTLFVSLEAEMISVRSFVALQKLRYGTEITLKSDLPKILLKRMVPTFLLLPLIENATKFGYRPNSGEVNIQISAAGDDRRLAITLSNPGNLSERRHELPGTRTGLNNLRGRLALHYPDRHSLTLNQEGDRVVARIELEGDPC